MSFYKSLKNLLVSILTCRIASCRTYSKPKVVIVIFPGHLNHLSLPSMSDEPRVMIGSNFFIEGLIGKEENYEQIYI